MYDNICRTFRRDGIWEGTRCSTVAVFRPYLHSLSDLRWPDCHSPRDLGFISDSAGYLLDLVEPSKTSLILGYAGSITAFAVACYALGYAALAPGVVTVHRVLGALALYLNIGLMFGTIYQLIWSFIPSSLTNIPTGANSQFDATIVYFSFVTLTSTGFGEIVPVHPLVRTLANVSAG